MSEKVLCIVDTVQGSEISADQFHNEIGTLLSLFVGLEFLYNNVRNCENLAVNSENGAATAAFAANIESAFGLPAGSNHLLPCSYHWFGNSIVNFVRLFGYLKGMALGHLPRPPHSSNAIKKQIKNYCSDYVASVDEIRMPLIWRNKVFAHFANTDPRSSDSDDLLMNTLFYPVSFRQGKFVVGGWQIFNGPSPDFSDKDNLPLPSNVVDSGLPSWSLTEVFEQIQNRYVVDWKSKV